MAFRAIGVDEGKPWCVDAMANAFLGGFPSIKQERTDGNGYESGKLLWFAAPSGAPGPEPTDR